MNLLERIESKPSVLSGKPVIRDTRLSVELILRKLSQGASVEELQTMYPGLSVDDVHACLLYSAEVIAGEEIIAL